jgi:hypothetical protein
VKPGLYIRVSFVIMRSVQIPTRPFLIFLLFGGICACGPSPVPRDKMEKIKEEIQDLEGRKDLTSDQEQRKKRSDSLITVKGIKLNKTLPFIECEDSTQLRSTQEIAQRVTVLAAVNMVAFGNFKGQDIIDYLKRFGLWEYTTPKEKKFLSAPGKEAMDNETWKAEGILTLLWALKVVPELEFPKQLGDLNKIPKENYPFSGLKSDPAPFIKKMTELRSVSELLNAADLYYRLDWACVDARVNNRSIEGVVPDVVYERHYALNWIIHYMNQSWDDITCDT